MQKLVGLVRRCVEDYSMIEDGDKVAVGVSGGKDSLVLLKLLAALRSYHNKNFQLEAITIDMGLGMDYTEIAQLCKELDVPYTVVKTEIGPIIFDYRKEKNPCSMCSKMRRGALNQALVDKGFHKLALGHHYDDAVETFLMSLIYEGRISCFQPVTHLDRTGITQIRPMLYVGEKAISHFAAAQDLPVVHNVCPADKHTKRQEIKELIREMKKKNPFVEGNIFKSVENVNIETVIAYKKDGVKHHFLDNYENRFSYKSVRHSLYLVCCLIAPLPLLPVPLPAGNR